MAASWIKVEVITPDKPEVFQLSEILNLDPDAVLGKLVRLWAWADQQTIDGNAKCNAASVTKNAVDRITFVSGFADALISVGWLALDGETLVFPNFERHNGNSSKKRALTNNRVANSRKVKRGSNAKGNAISNAASVTDAYQKALPEVEEEEDLKDKPLSLLGAGEISPDGQGSPPTPWEDQDDENPCGKFPMSANWAPTVDFQRLAALWGRIIDGPAPGYTPQELASFQAYWKAEGRVFNQTQWEQKFADSVLYERQAAAKRKQHAGGSNATRYTAAAATAQQQVRAARNAERERQGLAPLGDDGGDLRQPLGDQKRGGTLHDLGPDDFEILR
ncbi:DnaT-like ssDNA-binding domain-containing protein [Serratia montpellierensis]|uniref:DnaT-like ssDNA-binding domain-containing protein n=1 Tax=Serratia montpellierensis TaxID=2598730 RepID=UPI001E2D3616|nr:MULTISPECIES: DnaT-like ssDNA-binding domain-containing protein [unclassified Serratia (in: enterobacteria)]